MIGDDVELSVKKHVSEKGFIMMNVHVWKC
jgi:hypothetical protein